MLYFLHAWVCGIRSLTASCPFWNVDKEGRKDTIQALFQDGKPANEGKRNKGEDKRLCATDMSPQA